MVRLENLFRRNKPRRCPVCEERGPEVICDLTGNCGNIDSTFRLVGCARCDLFYLDPLPTQDELARIYVGNQQFLNDPHYVGIGQYAAYQHYLRCIERIMTRLGPREAPRLLEVGAGLAAMSRAAKAHAKDFHTVAQDITPEAELFARPWVDLYLVDYMAALRERLIQEGPFDIISLTHVVEHLTEPIDVLAMCADMLADDGVLFITAPHRPPGFTPGSVLGEEHRTQWREWSYNHTPAHVQYFGKQSMERLAARLGLRVAFWSAEDEEGQAFEAWLMRV